MLKEKTQKLELRREVCLFVGYPKGTRGGLFYSPQEKKVFVSTNATFLGNEYMTNFKPRSKVVLEELLSDQISPQPVIVTGMRNKETTVSNQDTITPRRSGRVIRPPARYRENGEANVVVTKSSDDDPLTYKHAMEDPDKEKWQEAMNQEMESMYSNLIWKLVYPP